MLLLNVQYVHHLCILTPLNECNLIKQLEHSQFMRGMKSSFPQRVIADLFNVLLFSIQCNANTKTNTWACMFVCFVSVFRAAKTTEQLHGWWILITVLTELFLLKWRAIPAVASDPCSQTMKLLIPLQSHWRVTVTFLQSVDIWRQHYPQQL